MYDIATNQAVSDAMRELKEKCEKFYVNLDRWGGDDDLWILKEDLTEEIDKYILNEEK